MIKEERQQVILDMIDEHSIVKVSEFTEALGVTDMTIRRDLQELEDQDLLIRVHGGARKLEPNGTMPFLELSHSQKRHINPDDKAEIAQMIAQEIHDHETVFLGSGTTIELVYNYLQNLNYAKIITNSIYVFNQFKLDDRFELILIGGTYRSKTGSFTGTITNDFVSSIHVQKAFIGVNAINEQLIFNANEDEGLIQRNVLDNARKRYIVADGNKFDRVDFYQFYNLDQIDYLITDSNLDESVRKRYAQWVEIIQPNQSDKS